MTYYKSIKEFAKNMPVFGLSKDYSGLQSLSELVKRWTVTCDGMV